jgi:hypothetical protein
MFVLLFFLALGCELFCTEVSVRQFVLSFCRACYTLFDYVKLFLRSLMIINPKHFQTL